MCAAVRTGPDLGRAGSDLGCPLLLMLFLLNPADAGGAPIPRRRDVTRQPGDSAGEDAHAARQPGTPERLAGFAFGGRCGFWRGSHPRSNSVI